MRAGHPTRNASINQTIILQPPAMPPIRSKSSRNSIEQEGRILLAIQAIRKQEIHSIREAARCFQVPRSTLQDRLHGHTERTATHANNHKLTIIEEESLQKWILSLDDRGAAPRPTTVRQSANLLLEARGSTPVQTVGEKWVYNYIKRHSDIVTQFSRRYNYERAKCEDPKIIRGWFDCVQSSII
jgi:hypothetical protein